MAKEEEKHGHKHMDKKSASMLGLAGAAVGLAAATAFYLKKHPEKMDQLKKKMDHKNSK